METLDAENKTLKEEIEKIKSESIMIIKEIFNTKLLPNNIYFFPILKILDYLLKNQDPK